MTYSPRILITNDDGIRAPGIKVLENLARKITDDVWIVAPQEEQSGMGHALTYRDPLRLQKVSPRHYAVDGTPTDCVIIAMEKIFTDHRPDLILSGVNNGENLGESLTHSGTVGAAFQGTLYNTPSIALSQVTKESSPIDWSVVEYYGEQVIREIIKQSHPRNTLINVNFPHVAVKDVAGIRVVSQGRRHELSSMIECVDPRGTPYYWVGVLRDDENPTEDTDLWAVKQGYISITPIQIDMTDYAHLQKLKHAIDQQIHNNLQVNKAV